MKKQQRGTSLIEMLVVVAIVGLVAGIGISSITSQVERSALKCGVDDVERTSRTRRNDGRATCLRLRHGDPKVLLPRMDEGDRRTVEVAQRRIVDRSDEIDVARRACLELGARRAVADDDQSVREAAECRDGELRPFVADESADIQEMVAANSVVRREEIRANGRMDDPGIAPVGGAEVRQRSNNAVCTCLLASIWSWKKV